MQLLTSICNFQQLLDYSRRLLQYTLKKPLIYAVFLYFANIFANINEL